MCGIALFLPGYGASLEHLHSPISNRGPDSISSIETSSGICACASVLHIQGNDITLQPYLIDDDFILLWNGEVFGGLGLFEGSDTPVVANLIRNVSLRTDVGFRIALADELSVIQGPYAFILLRKSSGDIYYGRDPFGRRSLVLATMEDAFVGLTSVIPSTKCGISCEWQEVPTCGIYTVRYDSSDAGSNSLIPSLTPWPVSRLGLSRSLCHTEVKSEDISLEQSTAQTFLSTLQGAIDRRVRNLWTCKDMCEADTSTCSVAVLFSGGIDSVLLAALLHHSLHDAPEQTIDLLNVTFMTSKTVVEKHSPDRLAAIVAVEELKRLFPKRKWRLVHVDVEAEERETHSDHILSCVAPSDTHMDLNIGTAFWFAARGKGYFHPGGYSAEEVLAAFSATVDTNAAESTTAEQLLRLGNASSKQWTQENRASDEPKEAVRIPCSNDQCRRVSKEKCIFQLCKRCCNEKTEAMGISSSSTAPVVCPAHKRARAGCKRGQHTVNSTAGGSPMVANDDVDSASSPAMVQLSEELASVASVQTSTPIKEMYHCQARTLLVGIGADEQMGGYGRHRTAYVRGGLEAMEKEMNMDMQRLWKRNLGRDDRCITDNGKEAWFPYLDEEVVGLLQRTPLDQMVNMELSPGTGDKRILRQAALALGIDQCSYLVKRAIQFGTRVAKHTSVEYHGSIRKGKGTHKYGNMCVVMDQNFPITGEPTTVYTKSEQLHLNNYTI